MFETADLNIIKNMMQKFIIDNPHKIKSIELFRELFLSRLESPDLPELDYLISEAEKNVLLVYGTDNYNQIKKIYLGLLDLWKKPKMKNIHFRLSFILFLPNTSCLNILLPRKTQLLLGKKFRYIKCIK
jgi:hypothetical protein